MKRSLTLLVLGAISWGMVGPVAAQELPPPGVASSNVKLLGTLPNPGAIGARFRGNVMYVSTSTGLTTYDVSSPAAPRELGRLALPHFENEDVDLGGNILLISNDAGESRGILYVIDISNPATPKILSFLDMGGLAGNGAIIDVFKDWTGVEVGNAGHTASCILQCRYAWVTDGGGIRVVDLTVPTMPKMLGYHDTPAGGLVVHDVQVDGNGLAWIVGYGGAAAYRIPADYAGVGLGQLVAKTNAEGISRYGETFGLDDGSTENDFIHHNSLRRRDDDVVFITEEDYSRPGCRGAGSFQTWRLPLNRKRVPTGADLTPLDMWTTELLEDTANASAVCSAHYFDLRSNVVAQGWYEQGMRLLDVSDPADIRQIGYWIPARNVSWAAYFAPTDPSGRIIYALDATRGIDVLEFDRPAAGPISEGCDTRVTNSGRSSGGRGKCAGERSAPVRAPLLPEWTAAPQGVSDPRFGYACRVGL